MRRLKIWLLALYTSSILFDHSVYCKTTTIKPANEIGKIAIQKCEEYSNWQDSLVLTKDHSKITRACNINTEKYILGGYEEPGIKFPHLARLGYGEKNYSNLCEASLISDEYLLTAAHCLVRTSPVVVKLGSESESPEVVKIKSVILHPEWEISKKYHDIALIRLEKPLDEFTEYIRPACIQVEKDIKEKEGIVSGYGSSNVGKQKDSNLQIFLPFVNHSDCSKAYAEFNNFKTELDEESMICAGRKGAKDCRSNEFAAAPIQIIKKAPHCMYNIVGITSFEPPCESAPNVYTRLSKYVSWIESVVWPDG